jgi:hypothetical protein
MDPSDINIFPAKILVINKSDGCDTSSFLLGQVFPSPFQKLHLIMNGLHAFFYLTRIISHYFFFFSYVGLT